MAVGKKNIVANDDIEVEGMMCCACSEIHLLHKGESALANLLGIYHHIDNEDIKSPFLIFTEANDIKTKYGQQLTALIRRNQLGKVRISSQRHNPNSYNDVTVFIWEVNYQAFESWYKKQQAKYNIVNDPFDDDDDDDDEFEVWSRPLRPAFYM